MTRYPHLFSPYTIRGVTFRNRIFATPSLTAWPNPDGSPNLTVIYDSIHRAKGGVALVTQGESCVNRTHAVRGNMSFLVPEKRFEGYVNIIPSNGHSKLAAAISRHGAIPGIQLFHAGENASEVLSEGRGVWGPTGYSRPDGTVVHEMDEGMMAEVCADFEKSAAIAKECGYRLIQIHGAHGWLLSQFLSPLNNKRTDGFGGSLENRARFPMMVADAIRSGAGPDIVIEYRISGEEHVEGGMHIDEVAEFATMIQEKVDIIHVSAGSYWSAGHYTFSTVYQPHGLNIELAAEVKKRVNIPVTVVGGFSDPAQMEQVIAEGKADFIGICRQLLADPEMPNKAYWGKEEEIRPCIRCANCLGRKYFGHHNCDINPISCNGEFIADSILPVEGKRRVLVVGGGPGGMTAAITAAGRGHNVTLVEKEDELGGMFRRVAVDRHKEDLRTYTNYLINQVRENNVDVRLNTEGSPELLDEIQPDHLIVAVGARAIVPRFKGADLLHTMTAVEVYDKTDEVGKEVVIIGGGLAGCETAIFLKDKGHKVTVIEMAGDVARDANRIYYSAIKEELSKGITCMVNSCCVELSAEGVVVEDGQGNRRTLACDTTVYAVGMTPNREAVDALREKFGFGHFRDIGDCYKAETVRQAVHNGYWAAMDIV